MAPLEVTTSFLKDSLSVALKTAADYLQAATDMVPGTWSLSRDTLVKADGTGLPHYAWLWISHGAARHESNGATEEAENTRGAAAGALVAAATRLTERLRRAAEAYDATDKEAGDNLDSQMVSG